MRSLAIFHLGARGGPSRSLVGAVSWLRERGSVELIVPEHGATEATYREFGPVTVRRYGTLAYARGPRQLARAVQELSRDVRVFRDELRRRRPDVVVVVTTVLPAAVIAARIERVPCVVYAAEIYAPDGDGASPRRIWGALLARATALLAGGLVCCSRAVARQFPRRPRRPLAVAYPPIDERYASGDRERGRDRYGLAAGDLCLAVVGDVSRGRGQDVALRALSLVRERHRSARLLVVGAPHPRAVDVAFAAELRELARRLGVEDAVVFAEPTDAMADVYAAADVVINPVRVAESFGRVVPEALVAGRPAVASRIGAIPEAVRDGVDALLVTPDDARELAAAVTRLVEDPALAERLVASGRRRVLAEFGEEQSTAAWRSVLEAVGSGGRKPARAAGTAARPHRGADRPHQRHEQDSR